MARKRIWIRRKHRASVHWHRLSKSYAMIAGAPGARFPSRNLVLEFGVYIGVYKGGMINYQAKKFLS